MRLENWSIEFAVRAVYSPPESGFPVLTGDVYGRDGFPDGDRVTTSRLMKIENGEAWTVSGSHYTLGKPAERYKQWCEANGLNITSTNLEKP